MSRSFHLLIDHIKNVVPLTDDEEKKICSYLNTRSVRKKQILVAEGDYTRNEHFVVKGCFRLFYVDKLGKEYIMRFAVENYWVTDLDSFTNNTAATQFVEALEDGELITLSKEAMDALLTDIPVLHKYFMTIYRNAVIATYKRIQQNFTLTVLDRYTFFKKKYPNIEQRVPQYMIASYLGITPEFLSKIKQSH